MTLNQFLKELEKTPRRWRADRRGHLRCATGRCPLEAVGETSMGGFFHAAKTLGIPTSQRRRIVSAADGAAYPKLRARLLKACGIKEQ